MPPFILSPEAKGIRTFFARRAKKTYGDERGGGVIKHLPNQSACGLTSSPFCQFQDRKPDLRAFSFFAQNRIGNLCDCDDVMQHIFLTVTLLVSPRVIKHFTSQPLLAKHTYEDPVVLQGGRGQILTTNFILRHTNVTSGVRFLLCNYCLSTILQRSSSVKDETWGGGVT